MNKFNFFRSHLAQKTATEIHKAFTAFLRNVLWAVLCLSLLYTTWMRVMKELKEMCESEMLFKRCANDLHFIIIIAARNNFNSTIGLGLISRVA